MTFANSSIEKAINDKKSIVEELKDLRDNSYEINQFLQSRQQSNSNKKNLIKIKEVQTTNKRINDHFITNLLRNKQKIEKNDKIKEIRDKVVYLYRNKV